jgi:hypothetical protein
MGKTVATILVILLLIVGGFWLFGRGTGDIARDGTNATTTEELTGTGGGEDNFDPLENFQFNGEDDRDFGDKG